MMIDTHCHLNFDSYNVDREAVIAQARAVGVERIVIPAVDVETSREALQLAEQHTGIFGAVGVHPNDTAEFDEAILAELERLSHRPKVVAIGEIGLDYYWDKSPKDRQAEAFKAQLGLAKARALPVIIHNRDASADVMPILETWAQELPSVLVGRAGVLHSFSASWEVAERALNAGFYLGFTGPVTFKKAEDLRRIVQKVPLDRLLVETDAPFLTPEPYRGKRNSPAYIPHIVDAIAGVHGVSTERIAELTSANAERLFQFSRW